MCATVVDERLRIVRVVVPYGYSDRASLCAIIDAALDARKPGAYETEARNGR